MNDLQQLMMLEGIKARAQHEARLTGVLNPFQQRQIEIQRANQALAQERMLARLTPEQLLGNTQVGGRSYEQALIDSLQGGLIPEVATQNLLLASDPSLPMPSNARISESDLQRKIMEYNMVAEFPGLARMLSPEVIDAAILEQLAINNLMNKNEGF